MIADAKPKKEFEKPAADVYVGVLADIVYFEKETAWGLKTKARFVWLLDAKDKEGNYFRVMKEVNHTLGEGSHLYALATDIRKGVAPPVPYEIDEMLGTASNIVVTRSTGIDKKTGKPREYANVGNILPLKPGQSFAIPADFKRQKDKPARTTQQAAQQQPAAAQQSASVQVQSPAPAASQQDNSDEIDF